MALSSAIGETSWDDLVAHSECGHLLQTQSWAALKSEFGWESQLVTRREADDLVAGAQLLTRWSPLLRLFSVAYVPKGPVVDWRNTERVRAILGDLLASARQRRAILLRIEPNLPESEMVAVEPVLAACGFWPAGRSVQPRRTILVDISGDEDEILGRMKQKTRYNIRLAGRKEVTVREGGREDLADFNRLMQVTGGRNAFGVHSADYYRAAYDLFSAEERVGLLLAEYAGRPLAALMVFALGDTAWYLYGASSDEERRRMPAYLLQWEAIRWARARGCCRYDLWGVPDADEETLEANFTKRTDGLWGVYRFKRGFGGQLKRWAGAYDHVLNRPLYQISKRLIG
jgi:lipid II:glycine glycyltransferase (peptidoglycan interpeptide bridge formation enzyme)